MNEMRRMLMTMVLWLMASSWLLAQPPKELVVLSPNVGEAAAAVDGETITALQKEAEGTADLSDDDKKLVSELAQQALNDLKAAAALSQTIAELEQRTATIPKDLERVERELADIEQAGEARLEGETSISELDITRNELQQRITELEQQLTLPAVDPAARSAKRKGDRQFLIELPPQQQTIQGDLQATAPEGEPPVISKLRQASLQAKQLLLKKKATAAQNELTLFDAEDAVKLPALRRELLTRELNRTRKLVELHVAEINRLRKAEAKARVREAHDAAMQAQPLLKPILDANEQIATEETDIRRLHEVDQETLKEIKAQLAELREDHREIVELDKQQLGLSGSMGLRLRKLRAQMPNIREHELQRLERLEALEDAEYTLYERRDALNDLLDVESAATEIVDASGLRGEKQDQLREDALTALRNQQDYLENVVSAYNRYTETLALLDRLELVLINETREFTSFVDQRILWIRSHRPLSLSETLEDRESASALWDVGAWRSIAQALVNDIRKVPWLSAGAGVVLLVLMLFHQRVGRHLREIAKVAQSRGVVSFVPTFRALEYTLLVSLTWPGLMWFISWRLTNSPDPPRIVLAAAVALSRMSGVFLLLELLRQSLRPHGLCDAHFGWPKGTLRAVRASMRKLMIFGLPLAAAIGVIHFHDGDGRYAAVERLFFIAAMLVLSHFAHSLLHPSRGAFRELRALHAGGWLDRLNSLWYVLAVGLPLLLASLAAAGYYYSAQKLMIRSQVTVFLVLAAFYGRALMLRWVMLRHRRLKIQQLHERHAAQSTENLTHQTEGGAPLPDVSLEAADLTSVSRQTQRLISTTLILLCMVCLWFIWSDVVPAVKFLDRWPLWTSVSQVIEQVKQEDGTFEPVPRYELQAITIANLAMACMIITLTMTAARNLPGLLEITVLQRLPIDRSTAYAVTALVRYALVLVGIMTASQTMGIGWAKVQWLVAALTFGLGFGLQEIFANFVSGIIILFEQPVRVGDVVTIDGVSGVVNRIRIRATTIVDWDRKEYIVPNREFITGRLLNWTLSDKMNRVVINVGVAYGSDTSLVREVILQVARDHENVLEDPAPLVTFESFGDSSLDFVLRAYLPNLDNRLQTIHDLHASINDRLAAQQIEIPFPQRDLHVRTSIRIDGGQHSTPNGQAAEAASQSPKR